METTKTNFDDIRPYNEEEIPTAMKRITEDSWFPLVVSFVYPNEPLDKVKQQISNYKTTHEFQAKTMTVVNDRIIESSISDFTCSGLERLDKNMSYLYVSNHRDIMLDSSLLQNFLVRNGFDTTEITFGANLMVNQFVIDIGKSNKMFRVERLVRPCKDLKEFYRSSVHTSEYIRYAITKKHQSVWIAQRNGRTKDGNDLTDQGVIKMFCMSKRDDKVQALNELNIVPIAISYEWESCDVLKAIELYNSMHTFYKKKPGEDINSIITGILQEKGRVHIELCEPIREEELKTLSSLFDKEYNAAVAKLIDERIHSAYHLYPNNYIAYDIRHNSSYFADMYNAKQKEEFMSHVNALKQYESYDFAQLKDIYLQIYSNPVENKL